MIRFVLNLLLLSCSLSLCGQNVTTLKDLEEKFIAGERSSDFLKLYWNAVKKESKDLQEREKILDLYLMSLPLDVRYSEENMQDLMSNLYSINNESYKELVVNIEALDLDSVSVQKVFDKLGQSISMEFFNRFVVNTEDCCVSSWGLQEVENMLLKSKYSNTRSIYYLVCIWNAFEKNDLERMVEVFCCLFEDFDSKVMFDWGVLNTLSSYFLENCNLKQCVRLLSLFNSYIDDGKLTKNCKSLIDIRDSFEGKKMMIEMGEE